MDNVIDIDKYRNEFIDGDEVLSVSHADIMFKNLYNMLANAREMLINAIKLKFDYLGYKGTIDPYNAFAAVLEAMKVTSFEDSRKAIQCLYGLEDALLHQMSWCIKYDTVIKYKYNNTPGFIAFDSAQGSLFQADKVADLIDSIHQIKLELSMDYWTSVEDFNKLFTLDEQ